jgi:hypothetical protein
VADRSNSNPINQPGLNRTMPDVSESDRLLPLSFSGNAVRVGKAEPFDRAWHRAISPTLAEWDSANDRENFDDL